MTEESKDTFTTAVKNQAESIRLTERLFEVVEPDTVFGRPRKSGDYTLITASEVSVGLGSGYGFGSYNPSEVEAPDDAEVPEYGAGGGGGGGGMSAARPVAIISVGPDGVQVQPIIDRTKFGIALLTTVGSMFLAISRMKKG
jgi:uncharacterized spore protein YtfJ